MESDDVTGAVGPERLPQVAAAGYRRSSGTPRAAARKAELLERVTEDLAVNGLVDFSLRRAARAAGTTHKVLLYHFDGAEDLLAQAVFRLRERRIRAALAELGRLPDADSLAARVRVAWAVLTGEEPGLRRVLDQAMGLAMYDPVRYGRLGRDASGQYVPVLRSFCPPDWPEDRKTQVAQMVLATLRGFLLERLISGDEAGVAAGFEALLRMLESEEAQGG